MKDIKKPEFMLEAMRGRRGFIAARDVDRDCSLCGQFDRNVHWYDSFNDRLFRE